MIDKIKYFTSIGNVLALREFIKNNHDLLFCPIYGKKGEIGLLHVAAQHGSLDVCKYLVDYGLSINQSSDSGATPLQEAAYYGQSQAVQWLLENGAYVDGSVDSISSPLISAVIGGHIDAVKLLIQHKAEINRLHLRFNATPLDEAQVWKREEIYNFLKKAGGISSIEEPAHWKNEPWYQIVVHVNNTLGRVFPFDFFGNRKVPGIDLRASRINNKENFKLLFTVGLYKITSPMLELMMVLPGEWPINDWAVRDDGIYAFPQKMLAVLVEMIKNKHQIQAGHVVYPSDPGFNEFIWPDSIKSFIVTDVCWTDSPDDNKKSPPDDEVSLLTLTPCKKKGKLTADYIESWLVKYKYAKITRFSLPLPARIVP